MRKIINFITEIGIGFVFRFFVIFWLFLSGFGGLHNWIGRSLFAEIIFTTLIFISSYLLFNLFSRKVINYKHWSIAAFVFILVTIIGYAYAAFSIGEMPSLSWETINFGLDGLSNY